MMDIQTQYPGLLEAMMIKESANRTHPKGDPQAIGDLKLKNKAYGILQIRQPYCDDAALILGVRHKAVDCLGDIPLSIRIVNAYMTRYATKKRLGHEPTMEEIARMHNGGPNGHKVPATLKYWQETRAIMQRQK